LAKIKNTVDINVTEKGSKKAASNINEVTKAQTRQTSAGVSASKQFAAQSQGLGGFVAAYAGAAANVFALQQAFAALQRAVQFETVIQGTKALASEIGISGQAVLNSVKDITNGQIAIEEAAQNVNIALSAGFNTEQIEKLSDIATKASRVLGRNLTDSLQRVVRGTSKLEPELLDEIGIFARIDPAVEAYASKLNVSASSLTNFEKRQAFANAVIEEGEKKFAAIDTTVGGNQATLEKFVVQLQELAIGFGQVVANVLSPLIEFLSDNNRALLVFLGILTLVFGKAAALVGASVGKMIERLTKFSDKLADMGKKSKEVGKELAGSFDVAKGAEGSIGEGKGFNPRIAGQDAKQQAKLQETLNRQKQNNLKTTSQLTKANAVYTRSLQELNKNADGNAKRIAFLNSLLAQNKAALNNASASAKIFAGASIVAANAVNFLSFAFGKLQAALGIIFAVTAAFQLFGFDVIGEISKIFQDFSQRAEDANVTLNGLLTVATGGSAAFQKLAQAQGISKKELEDLKETQEDVAKVIRSSDTELVQFAAKFTFLKKRVDELQNTGFGFEVATQIALLEKELDDTSDKLERLVIEQAIKGLKDLGDSSLFLADAAREAGLSGEQAAKGLAFLERRGVNTGKVLEDFGDDLNNLSKEGKGFAGDFAALGKVLSTANEAFEQGRTNTEKLSQQLFGAQTRFNSAQKIISQAAVVTREMAEAFQEAQEELDLLNSRVRGLKDLDAIGKGLDNTFGKFIKAADEAAFKGIFGAEQTAASQAALLKSIIQAGEAAEESEEIDQQTRKEIELGNKARKVALGLALELPKILDEQLRKQRQINQTLQIELETTRKQNVLKEEQQKLDSLRISQNIENKQAAELTKKLEVQKRLQEQIVSSIKSKAQFQREMISLQAKENEIVRSLAEIRRKAAAEANIGAVDADIRAVQSERAEQQAFPGLFTRSQVDEKRRELIFLEFEKQLLIINEKERQIKEEAETERIALRERILQLAKEREEQQKLLDKTIAIQEIEKQLEANKQKAETDKIKQENERLRQQKIIVDAERESQLSALRGRVLAQKFADQAELRELEALEANVELVNAFQKAVGVTPFVEAIDKFVREKQFERGLRGKEITGIGDLSKFEPAKIGINAAELRKQIEGNQAMRAQQFSAQAAAISGAAGAKTGDLNAQIAANQVLLRDTQERQSLESQLSEMKRQDAITELENQIKISDKKIENAFKEFDVIDAEETRALDAEMRRRDAAKDLLKDKLDEIKRERDALKNFGSEVSQLFSGELTNSFKSFYQSIAEGNSVLDSAKSAFQSFLLNIVEGLQEKLTDKFITPVLEDIGAGIFGSIFNAGGGPIHLAGGGAMKRDRVPAMLEPGEFVIRKPMARAIGGPALSAMNGHGKGLGMPTIDVQINNSGQPKDAEAQVKPNMDVNKMVVEIVTRDLRNNGPIRKTLRGDS